MNICLSHNLKERSTHFPLRTDMRNLYVWAGAKYFFLSDKSFRERRKEKEGGRTESEILIYFTLVQRISLNNSLSLEIGSPALKT